MSNAGMFLSATGHELSGGLEDSEQRQTECLGKLCTQPQPVCGKGSYGGGLLSFYLDTA